ncbi:MAG TPA: LD-carboxypeptidase [Solirubrobacteraceae bacterium]
MLRPARLRPGDTIGVVAPSWCGPTEHPHRVERGVRFLERRGWRVRLGAHALGRRGYRSGTTESARPTCFGLAEAGVRAD